MIAHVVLFRPAARLSRLDRQALLDAMRHAFAGIDEIRRARIGRRTVLGRAYDAQMREDFEYAAIIEFDSESALRAYLDHPAHIELGRRFSQSADAALVYDFVMVEPGQVTDWLD